METIKTHWKRYLVSSIITFLATFLLMAVPEFLNEQFVWSYTAIISVLVVAVRLGLKAVWELLRPVIAGLLVSFRD